MVHTNTRQRKKQKHFRSTKWVKPEYVHDTFAAVQFARKIGNIRLASDLCNVNGERIPERTLRRYVHLSYNKTASISKFGVFFPPTAGEKILQQNQCLRPPKKTKDPFEIAFKYLDAQEAFRKYTETLPFDYLGWKLGEEQVHQPTIKHIRHLRKLQMEINRTAKLCTK